VRNRAYSAIEFRNRKLRNAETQDLDGEMVLALGLETMTGFLAGQQDQGLGGSTMDQMADVTAPKTSTLASALALDPELALALAAGWIEGSTEASMIEAVASTAIAEVQAPGLIGGLTDHTIEGLIEEGFTALAGRVRTIASVGEVPEVPEVLEVLVLSTALMAALMAALTAEDTAPVPAPASTVGQGQDQVREGSVARGD
jgi:hypothetical protein